MSNDTKIEWTTKQAAATDRWSAYHQAEIAGRLWEIRDGRSVQLYLWSDYAGHELQAVTDSVDTAKAYAEAY